MTISELYYLLYEHPELAHIKLHVSRNDFPEVAVKVIPLDIAVFIRDNDPEESHFHVEFFPTHAELWEGKCWRNSITRRLKHAGVYANTQATTTELTLHKLQHNLLSHFKSCGLPFRHARDMTEMLISGPQNPGLLQLAALPPELQGELRAYRTNENPE